MAQPLTTYVTLECDCCNDAITDAPIFVHGNNELFCSLTCCKIFYSREVKWISLFRKEKKNAT